MDFVKGIKLLDGKVLLEGTDVRLVTYQGEVVEGVIMKAAKKEIVLAIDEVRRIFELSEIRDMNIRNVE